MLRRRDFPTPPVDVTHLTQALLCAEATALNDQQILYLLLCRMLPESGAASEARHLCRRFGSLATVLSASREELLRACSHGIAEVAMLRLVRECAVRLSRVGVRDAPILDNWPRLLDYLQAVQGHARDEEARVLYLDRTNRLLADEGQGRGTVDQAPLYVREIMRRALEVRASALLLVHNHPSGDPRPSETDLRITDHLASAAKALGLVLHDHIIIGAGRPFSFREGGLL